MDSSGNTTVHSANHTRGVSFDFMYTNLRTVIFVASNLYGASFAHVSPYGYASHPNASLNGGVRPVFDFKVLKIRCLDF